MTRKCAEKNLQLFDVFVDSISRIMVSKVLKSHSIDFAVHSRILQTSELSDWLVGRPIDALYLITQLLGRQSLYLQTHEMVKNGNTSPTRCLGLLNQVHLLPIA
jgi:hypothetical protein